MKPAAKPKKGKTIQQTTEATGFMMASGDDDRIACIATAAYFKAEARGFAPGGELSDWLAAEMEINAGGAR